MSFSFPLQICKAPTLNPRNYRDNRTLRSKNPTTQLERSGPLKVKHAMIHVKDEEDLPTKRYHLLVCDNPLTGERKYFISNAPAETPLKKLLQVAFSRWPIERCFEDQKGEVGLTHWEGRTWTGLQRHLILTSVSHLFLAIACQRLREKKSGGNRLPGTARCQCRGAVLVA